MTLVTVSETNYLAARAVLLCPVLLQLYRVNVLLQSPDALDLSSKPPFFVLRRYSQFRQLHAEVRHNNCSRL